MVSQFWKGVIHLVHLLFWEQFDPVPQYMENIILVLKAKMYNEFGERFLSDSCGYDEFHGLKW